MLSCLENVGGELNAYTTKEETCIHASFLKEYYNKAIELISDVAFNSVYPENELEKEKEVILDEINSYRSISRRTVEKDRCTFSLVCFNRHNHATSICVWPTTFTVTSVLFFSCCSLSCSPSHAVSTVS